MNHEILIETEVDGAEPYAGLLRRVIPAALEAEGVSFPCEVDVLFTDDAGIHAINLEQRGVDRPTDVLSFPMFQLTPGAPPTLDDVEADPGTGLVPLGDMVLSLERAEAQGAEYGHGAEREAAYLAVHSVLHLLGYDHLDEGPMKAQMRDREEAADGSEAFAVRRRRRGDLPARLRAAVHGAGRAGGRRRGRAGGLRRDFRPARRRIRLCLRPV